MELFSIQRYAGDVPASTDSNKEEEILQKLLQKAQKRKRNQDEALPKDSAPTSTDNKREQPVQDEESRHVFDKNDDDHPAPDIESKNEDNEEFQVLGSYAFEKKPKVDMVLPPWLAHPTVIATNLAESGLEEDAVSKCSFLSESMRNVLLEMSIKSLFPVQKAVVPWVLQAHSKPYPFRPRDICVSAPTGSGKTLSFAIPVVQLLSNRVEKRIRALVVLPVAELALQVFKVFKKLTEKTDLNVCLLSKSIQFATEQQKLVECYKEKFYSKVDIVITTPGRLVEHLHATKGFCLKSLKFLIIDEADRIMDQVHHNWLYHLNAHVKVTSDMLLSGRAAPLCLNELETSVSSQPHKMLFSATLSQDPEKLQNLRLFHPKLFTSVLTNLDDLKENVAQDKSTEVRGEFIGKYTTPAELTEKYCLTESRLKPLTLYSLIVENSWTKFLCFTNSVESSGRLAFVLKILLQDTLKIAELSAALNAKERANVLSEFARGKINGLVSSDALARGIDIPDVDIVISYDTARHIKTYIHRIGRTARAGRPGTAITLLTQKELNTFNHTLSEVGKALTQEIKVTTDAEENNAKLYSKALRKLRDKLDSDKQTKIIMKNLAKQKAKPVDPSKMSLMEKLQSQATAEIASKAKEIAGSIITTKERKNKNSIKAFKAKKATKALAAPSMNGKTKNRKTFKSRDV